MLQPESIKVNLVVPVSFRDRMRNLLPKQGYTSEADFIRDAIRRLLNELERR
jgi:Arc/MetJ-type ribon-helix-helix transcriptional regulator